MKYLGCDVLVIGGGAAGSRAAYEAKHQSPVLKVCLVMAGKFGTSGSTNLIASESLGINAPFNFMQDGDNDDIYFQDMITTGGGISDPNLCKIISKEACQRVEELINMGVPFANDKGVPIQDKLSGCTKARSLKCGGSTGRAIVKALKQKCREVGVIVYENMRALDLIKDDQLVKGALFDNQGEPVCLFAKAVILATGGAGRLFSYNVNPEHINGDGWAMAAKTGAKFVNMEFFQVGPGIIADRFQFIIHSHMWRLNPKLINRMNNEFLQNYCPENVSIDEVLSLKAMSYPFSVRTNAKYLDIAIFKEIQNGRGLKNGGVLFDVSHVSKDTLLEKAPITYRTLLNNGIDIANEPLEIGLMVQNFNGGVLINENGRSNIENLYCVGEISGGVHGSDRPGGNNLIDTQVFAYRAGKSSAEYIASISDQKHSEAISSLMDDKQYLALYKMGNDVTEKALLSELENLFYNNLTIIRSDKGLLEVLDFIDRHKNKYNNLEIQNRLIVGELIANSALLRKESRGTHYREDSPSENRDFIKRTEIIYEIEHNATSCDMALVPVLGLNNTTQ